MHRIGRATAQFDGWLYGVKRLENQGQVIGTNRYLPGKRFDLLLTLIFDGRLQKNWLAPENPLGPFTNGGLPALQVNARQKPSLTFGIVPIADSHDFEDRSLVIVVRNARAVTQIKVSFP